MIYRYCKRTNEAGSCGRFRVTSIANVLAELNKQHAIERFNLEPACMRAYED